MQKAFLLALLSGVEVGAGKVLMGLMKKNDRNIKIVPVEKSQTCTIKRIIMINLKEKNSCSYWRFTRDRVMK
jgi:hypothetical protein